MKKIIFSLDRLPKYWSFISIFIYSVLAAQYYQLLMQKTTPQTISVSNAFSWGMFILMIVSGIVVWLFSTLIFHLFSLLMGGTSTFIRLLRNNSYGYIVPAICLVAVLVILNNLQIPLGINVTEYLMQNPAMRLIGWIINGSFIIYFVLIVYFIKYLYEISFARAIGAVVIPVGLIYLLSLLFTHVA